MMGYKFDSHRYITRGVGFGEVAAYSYSFFESLNCVNISC